MEVQIGILNSVREITIEIEGDESEVAKAVEAALLDGAMLRGTDKKGRQLLIPTSSISHAIIGEAEERRVGFGL